MRRKDNVEVELALEGFTKPIGIAEYKLIVPQKELKQLISDEIKTFNQELADKSAEQSEEKDWAWPEFFFSPAHIYSLV